MYRYIFTVCPIGWYGKCNVYILNLLPGPLWKVNQMVVSNIFYVHPYLGEDSHLD